MKTMKLLSRIPILLTAVAVFSFTSCKKDNDELSNSTDSELAVYRSASQDFEQSEDLGNNIDLLSDEAARGHFGPGHNQGMLSPCATVTHDTISVPHILTIDFGPVNCQGIDGKWRRGMIVISYSGHYFDPGSTRSLSFQNFYVNDNHIEGTRTVTNNGLNSNGNMNWNIDVINFKITKPSGVWHERNSSRIRTIISGSGTPTPWDDVYLISGTSNGTNSNGHSITATITNDLRKEMACHWIVSGTVEITPSNRPTKILDFGSGACDNQATITINGVTHIITLH